MKALIYCRVSSQRQVDEGHGIDSQEQRCRMFAQSKQLEVVKVFPDEGVSGGLFDRPAMKELLSYLDARPLEKFVVVFDDLARFARDVKVHIQLKAEFKSREVRLECLNFNFDESEESEMAELMLAVSNQYQRKSNKRQVIQKMKSRIELGYWPFCPPPGLLNKIDPVQGKVLHKVEPVASIYKDAIEKFEGYNLLTPQAVREYINEQYRKQGLTNTISLNGTMKVLKQVLYAGYVEYSPWGIPLQKGRHEGFISFETYKAVQERIKKRSKNWSRKDTTNDFPLRHNILCDACGTPMTASWNTSGNNRKTKYPNYFCRNKDCMYVWKVSRKSKIEPEFEALLAKVKPADETLELANLVLSERWDIRKERYLLSNQNTRKSIDAVDSKIDSFMQRIGKSEDETMVSLYEVQIKNLIKEKEELGKQLAGDKYDGKDFGTAAKLVFDTLKKPVDMWQSDEYDKKKAILLMYFENKLRYDYEKGFGTDCLAPFINLIDDIGSKELASVEMGGYEPPSKKSF